MNYDDLVEAVQNHDDAIVSLQDTFEQNSTDLDSSLQDIQTNLDDLNQNEGQLMFPLSQDTIDLIKEQIPTSTQTTFGGMVLAAGTTSVLPTGWTVSKDGSNVYTITHNLNNANYTVVAQPLATDVTGGFNIDAGTPGGANSFSLDWYVGATRSARDFNFVLTLIQ